MEKKTKKKSVHYKGLTYGAKKNKFRQKQTLNVHQQVEQVSICSFIFQAQLAFNTIIGHYSVLPLL